MKRKFTFSIIAFLFLALTTSKLFGQSVYWREGFEGGEISTTNALSGGPNNYYAASVNSGSGSWYLHNTYRTTGTSCSGSGYGPNHLRLLQNGADSPYVVLPPVDNGVTEIHFARSANSATAGARTRRFAFFVRFDTIGNTNPYQGGGWTRIATANPGDLFCADTAVLVPTGLSNTVRRVAIGNSQAGNADVDSIWLISATPVTTPVNFISTKAFVTGSNVKVEWTTAEESGILNYIIERSNNGTSFQKAGTVVPTNSVAATYSWLDSNPSQGVNYYRIRAVEADKSKLTAILKVTIGKKGAIMVIASNPVKGNTLNLQLSGMEKGAYTLTLFNTAGQQVFAKAILLEGSSLSQNISLPQIGKGLFSIRLQSASSVLTNKIIIE